MKSRKGDTLRKKKRQPKGLPEVVGRLFYKIQRGGLPVLRVPVFIENFNGSIGQRMMRQGIEQIRCHCGVSGACQRAAFHLRHGFKPGGQHFGFHIGVEKRVYDVGNHFHAVAADGIQPADIGSYKARAAARTKGPAAG